MTPEEMIAVDLDAREAAIRRRIYDEADFWVTPPAEPDALIATYFLKTRGISLEHAAKEISYHMTSAEKHPVPGSLIAQCTGTMVGFKTWDASGQVGLLRVAYPTKMFERPDGQYYTTDILHIIGGAGLFAFWPFAEGKLVDIKMPQSVIDTFPGPAYGPDGLRKKTNWAVDEPAFGTILKPTAGITDDDVARLLEGVAGEPLFMFIKEDENLLPELSYSPIEGRARKGWAVVQRLLSQRGGRGVIFAPHITSPPHLILDVVKRVLDAGVNGIMFSEQHAQGMVRSVREFTKKMSDPPAIYGHNGGIDCRTNFIYREVIDLFARLDGIDFRQTAPISCGVPLLRPQGIEWQKSEEILSKSLGKIKPVMITRAGGLDQGNIILNLEDAAKNLPKGQVLYLAGSAINSIKGPSGKYDSKVGALAMRQAIDLWRAVDSPKFGPGAEYVKELHRIADAKGLAELKTALEQRYTLTEKKVGVH